MYIKVTSYEEMKQAGYQVAEDWKKQMDIIFSESSLLKDQTRINTKTHGIYLGAFNKLIGFIEPLNK